MLQWNEKVGQTSFLVSKWDAMRCVPHVLEAASCGDVSGSVCCGACVRHTQSRVAWRHNSRLYISQQPSLQQSLQEPSWRHAVLRATRPDSGDELLECMAPLCTFYLQGKCKYGISCRNLHPEQLSLDTQPKTDYKVSDAIGEACQRCLGKNLAVSPLAAMIIHGTR